MFITYTHNTIRFECWCLAEEVSDRPASARSDGSNASKASAKSSSGTPTPGAKDQVSSQDVSTTGEQKASTSGGSAKGSRPSSKGKHHFTEEPIAAFQHSK